MWLCSPIIIARKKGMEKAPNPAPSVVMAMRGVSTVAQFCQHSDSSMPDKYSQKMTHANA